MNCAICGREGAVLIDRPLNVFCCDGCSHRFTVLAPEDHQEAYDDGYFRQTHRNWFAHPDVGFFRRLHDEIRSRVPAPELELLDIGCGTGDFLRYLHAENDRWRLTGIDLIHNEHPRIRFLQGDLFTTSFARTFDVVTCLHVIEHVPDPQRLVEMIGRLLNPRGVAVIATVDSSSPIHQIAAGLRTVGFRAPYERIFSRHHLHHFSFRSLRTLMDREQFRTLEQFNYNHPLGAVDVPENGPIPPLAYKAAVAVMFRGSALAGKGMLQTIVCGRAAAP